MRHFLLLGILDDEFEEFLAAGKLSKFWSWYKRLGLHLETHRNNSISWISFDEELAPLQWCEEFIFPLKHPTQITEAGVQYIVTCLATGRSEEYASTLVSLCPIDIAPINREILKQFEVRKRKGNRPMKLGVGDNRQPISCQLNN